MAKRPYSFPHRSRKAMIAYLTDRRAYRDYYKRYSFAWNVKAHHVDYERPKGEYALDPAFDAEWRAEIESPDCWQISQAFEDARLGIADNEWTSYPGDDQGDWEFSFAGRQGGWLVLEKWRGWQIGGLESYEVEEWLSGLSLDALRDFYRGIRTADADFTAAKASENVEFYLNAIRGDWEAGRKAENDAENEALAAALMESRPDMYQAGDAA